MDQKVTKTQENWDFGRAVTQGQAWQEANQWIGTTSPHGKCVSVEVHPLPYADRAIVATMWQVTRYWEKKQAAVVWAVFFDTEDGGRELSGLRWEKEDAEKLYRTGIREEFQIKSVEDGKIVERDMPDLDKQFPWEEHGITPIKSSAEIMTMSWDRLDEIKAAFFEEHGPWTYMEEVTVL
jgi:hypothetical protein